MSTDESTSRIEGETHPRTFFDLGNVIADGPMAALAADGDSSIESQCRPAIAGPEAIGGSAESLDERPHLLGACGNFSLMDVAQHGG